MNRKVLTDGSGQWFDADTAETFPEATRWDGSNEISVATGSQWDHETLYRTSGGRWVLNSWSQREATVPTFEEIDDATAAAWLVRNEHGPHPACAAEYESLKIQ